MLSSSHNAQHLMQKIKWPKCQQIVIVLQDDSTTKVKQIKMPSSTVPTPATSAGCTSI